MAVGVVSHYSAPMNQGNLAQTYVCKLPFAVPSGCLILISANNAHGSSGTTPTASDDKGNTYTPDVAHDNSNQALSTFYCVNATNGPRIFTLTWSGSGKQYAQATVTVFFNVATSSPIAGSSHAAGTGTAIRAGAFTPSQANCAIFTLSCQDATLSTITSMIPVSGFTGLSEDVQDGLAAAYSVQTTAASVNAGFDQDASRSWICVALAIKSGAGGSNTGVPVKRFNQHNVTDSSLGTFVSQIDGDLACLLWNGAAGLLLNSISDSTGDTWVERGTYSELTGSGKVQIFDIENPTAGRHVLTLTTTGSAIVSTTLDICDIVGAAVTAFDVEAHNTGTNVSGAVPGPAFTPSQATSTLQISYVGITSNTATDSDVGNFASPDTTPPVGTAPVGEDNVRWFIITTSVSTVTPNHTVSGAAGNYAGKTVGYRLASGASYTLTCTPGSVAITGTSANLKAGRNLTASPGSLAITGTPASLTVNRRLTCTPGSVSVTGVSAALSVGHRLTANPGSVSISGTNANLIAGRHLTASPGSVSITGTDAGLRVGRTLQAFPGSVSITGTPALLHWGHELICQPGSVAITGTNAILSTGRERILSCTPGSIAINGVSALLTRGYRLLCLSGTMNITGIPAILTSGRLVHRGRRLVRMYSIQRMRDI